MRQTTAMPSDPCAACDLVRGARSAPGGVLARENGLVLHALLDPSPIPGWLVLTSERHARAWADLDAPALAALGPLAARVMTAQRAALGAEHVYAFAIGDLLRHFHLHLVPRYADTPERLRGRRCFDGRTEDARPEAELAGAARAVARAMERAPGR
jgi:diadenosine tetraphosphate (Ap4A) HIT family hydrolase